MTGQDKNIRVRFAPSPTGYLHTGSARTAFFNWLYAKKTGGKFIIRIEDTDISRHQEEAVGLILGSLKWLGLDWDEGPDIPGSYGPYRQSQRVEIYKKYGEKLVKNKHAYYCFCSPEKLKEKREEEAGKGRTYQYGKNCLKLPDKEILKRIERGDPHTIRILVPPDETLKFSDRVYGAIMVNTDTIDDYIIIRSNGLPTYNFSVAVDDILMKITHIIRGEDHLTNTAKQLLVYKALGASVPEFTHLPMIHGSDGQKLSKRHGSISIEAYREEGFLREAILNYLALLGWSYDEKTTIFSIDELINNFSLDSINKKPAKFDYDKLLWLNGSYIRDMDDKRLVPLIVQRIEDFLAGKQPGELEDNIESTRNMVEKILPSIKKRMKTINQFQDLTGPFFLKVKYSEEIRNYFKNKEISAPDVLNRAIGTLEEITEDGFSSSNIESSLRGLSESEGPNLRKLAEVLRIALWADKVSPPLFEAMEILGKELTLKRFKDYAKLIT